MRPRHGRQAAHGGFLSPTASPAAPNGAVVKASRRMVRLLATPYARFKASQEAPFPDGPWVGIFNHSSSADVAALAWIVDRPAGFWAKAELRDTLLGPWLAACGGVFVRRGQRDEAAFQEALARLRGGLPFVLAPEGTRRHEGAPKVHTGFVRLALEARCPVVPIVIAGAREVLPPGQVLPSGRRPLVHVRRLAPIHLPQMPADETHRDQLHELAVSLMARVYAERDRLEAMIP